MVTVDFIVSCERADGDGDGAVFSCIVKFATQKALDDAEGIGFDEMIEPINKWLKRSHPGFYVDDTIEPSRFIDESSEHSVDLIWE